MNDTGSEHCNEHEDPEYSDRPQQLSELLLGEVTAAIAADSRSALDALPAPLAERAALIGEVTVRAQKSLVPASRPPAPARANSRANSRAKSRANSRAKSRANSRAKSRAGSALLWSGWLAAAAMLTVVAGTSRTAANSPLGAATPGTPIALSPTALRDSLLAVDSTLRERPWLATDDSSAAGASGNVMWSARAQRGVMRIAGLAVNDPTRWQYQLWIFDRSRDERYPVDGGVFDVPAGGADVLITIDPAIAVGDAALFAVTVEPAGGVVVSTRERIVLTAAL